MSCYENYLFSVEYRYINIQAIVKDKTKIVIYNLNHRFREEISLSKIFVNTCSVVDIHSIIVRIIIIL